jgi:hypothetical protein
MVGCNVRQVPESDIARLLEMKEAAYFLPLVAGLISQAIRSHVSAMCSSMTR